MSLVHANAIKPQNHTDHVLNQCLGIYFIAFILMYGVAQYKVQ